MDNGFRIIGQYHGKREEIDTAETPQEAKSLIAEYRFSFGAGWLIWAERNWA